MGKPLGTLNRLLCWFSVPRDFFACDLRIQCPETRSGPRQRLVGRQIAPELGLAPIQRTRSHLAKPSEIFVNRCFVEYQIGPPTDMPPCTLPPGFQARGRISRGRPTEGPLPRRCRIDIRRGRGLGSSSSPVMVVHPRWRQALGLSEKRIEPPTDPGFVPAPSQGGNRKPGALNPWRPHARGFLPRARCQLDRLPLASTPQSASIAGEAPSANPKARRWATAEPGTDSRGPFRPR